MGLEGVELLVETEQAFGIKISDAEAEVCATMGQLQDLVLRKLAEKGNAGPPWQGLAETGLHCFRQAAREVLGPAAEGMVSETSLAELIPEAGRPEAWRRLTQAVARRGLTLPSLNLPRAVSRTAWIVAIPGYLATAVAAYWGTLLAADGLGAAERSGPPWPVEALAVAAAFVAPTALLFVAGAAVNRHWATAFPHVSTAGEIGERIIGASLRGLDLRHMSLTPDDVWLVLRTLVADVMMVDARTITRESEFVRDLGMG